MQLTDPKFRVQTLTYKPERARGGKDKQAKGRCEQENWQDETKKWASNFSPHGEEYSLNNHK